MDLLKIQTLLDCGMSAIEVSIELGENNQNEFYGNQKITCKACQLLETKQNKIDRRKFIIDAMGGKCIRCGYKKCIAALDVHHINPSIKDKNFNTISSQSKEKILNEIEKCILLCANCHREEHYSVKTLEE